MTAPGGGLGTSTEQMAQSATHIHDVQASIAAQLNGLRQRLSDLPMLWSGPTGAAFTALMVRWGDDATKLNTALGTIADQVRGGGATFAATEEAQHSAVGRISAAL